MYILKVKAFILFAVALLNIILAVLLWYSAKKDKAKLWLGFLALFSGFYAFFCGATYIFWNPQNTTASLLWYKTTWLGILILPCFVIFSYYFTNKTKHIFVKALALYVSAFVILYLVFTTDFFIKSLVLQGSNIASINGSFDIIGRTYILVGIIISLYNLVREYLKTTGFRKLQIRYFILGASLFLVIGSIATSIVPLIIKMSPYYDIAAYASFIWVSLTAYAILKYKLMDIKVVSTELFVFALWIALVTRVVSSESRGDFLINGIIFAAVVFFGIFLIRSVMKEVEQREEVAKAYAVEKKAKEELQQLDVVKNQFLMTTQHDLRKPLTSVKWFFDILLSGTLGKPNDAMVDAVKKIQLSVDSSIEEVNNFLDVAQFQIGKTGLVLDQGVDAVVIFDDVVKKLAPQAEAKKIYLKFMRPAAPVYIAADAVKFKVALSNIIDNAIKYTPSGGVAVSVNAGKEVAIEITDTGIGIPPEKVNTLLESMFERTEEAKKTTAIGKGIGLYLSGQIIKSHHGKIWVTSPGIGKGSTFHIVLPLSGPPVAKAAIPISPIKP